jgi:hypothetical protein
MKFWRDLSRLEMALGEGGDATPNYRPCLNILCTSRSNAGREGLRPNPFGIDLLRFVQNFVPENHTPRRRTKLLGRSVAASHRHEVFPRSRFHDAGRAKPPNTGL